MLTYLDVTDPAPPVSRVVSACRAYSEEYTGERSTKASSCATTTLTGTMTERGWMMSNRAEVTATEGQAEDQGISIASLR